MTSLPTAWHHLDDARHRSEFYRMWRAGAAAGFTVPRTLETMGPRAAPQVEELRQWLLEGTRRGAGVGDLVRRDRARFDDFESALLLLGEESGRLEGSLALLADFYARKHRLMLAVRKKMAYPLFTGILATAIAPLPLLVFGYAIEYVLTVSVGFALWFLAGGAIVRLLADRYGRQSALVRARLARALTTAIEAGLPQGRAIRLAADASGDPAVKNFVRSIDERTLGGQPISTTLANCPNMTPDFLGALQVAEMTGDFQVLAQEEDR